MAERLNWNDRTVLSCVHRHTDHDFLPATAKKIKEETEMLSDEVTTTIAKLTSMQLVERKSEGWIEEYWVTTEKGKEALEK